MSCAFENLAIFNYSEIIIYFVHNSITTRIKCNFVNNIFVNKRVVHLCNVLYYLLWSQKQH